MSKSSKGGAYEREISRLLTKWLTGTEKPYVYYRTPSSGAMLTIHGDMNMSGDIIAVRPEGEWFTTLYSVELKNGYPNTSLDLFFKYNKADHIKAFWEQCVRDADMSDKRPMLIYKKKGLSTQWLGVDSDIYKDILKDIRCISMTWGKEDNLPQLYLYEMKEFFERVTPSIMRDLLCI
jgi:hypothetical protein